MAVFFCFEGLRYRIFFDWDVEGRAASGKEDPFLFGSKIGIFRVQGTLGSRKNYSWRCPMDKIEMTPEQMLAIDGFIDVMVQIYKMTSDKIDYSKVEKDKDKQKTNGDVEDKAEA